jgi:hypothetical protein
MKLIAQIIVAAILLAHTPQAKACDETTIAYITSSGDVVELDDGTEWEIIAGDASAWNEGDDVLVCGTKLINQSDGESIDVVQR